MNFQSPSLAFGLSMILLYVLGLAPVLGKSLSYGNDKYKDKDIRSFNNSVLMYTGLNILC